LGLEQLNKEILVGTLVIVASVVLLPICVVEPGAQDDQDALVLLQSPAAIASNSFPIADGMAGSTLYLFWLSHKEKLPTPSEQHNWEFFIALLLTGQSSHYTGVMLDSSSVPFQIKLFVAAHPRLLPFGFRNCTLDHCELAHELYIPYSSHYCQTVLLLFQRPPV
jgi:hypothetical protein